MDIILLLPVLKCQEISCVGLDTGTALVIKKT